MGRNVGVGGRGGSPAHHAGKAAHVEQITLVWAGRRKEV